MNDGSGGMHFELGNIFSPQGDLMETYLYKSRDIYDYLRRKNYPINTNTDCFNMFNECGNHIDL